MKLGIISSGAASPWGGSEELWAALAKEALEDGCEVAVSIYDWKQLPAKVNHLKAKGAKVYLRSRVSYPDLKGKIRGKITQLVFAEKQLNNFILSESPDVLFISMGAFCDLEIDFLRSFILKLKIPFFIVIHSNTETHTVNEHKMEGIQIACKKATEILFVSKRIREQAERQIAYSFKNSGIAINPLNINEVGILRLPDDEVVNMACVGTILLKVKGQGLLLQILNQEKWKERKWVLNIYGKGPDEHLLKQLISFYGLNERVFYRGFTNDIRKDVWQKNHLLIMPSFIEGMPIVLMEAMLCGRTAVVTDVGGCRELVQDGFSGFISEGVTLFSIDKTLEKAWKNRSDWEKIGSVAYEEAAKYFGNNPVKDLLNRIKKNYIK
jgi:glycosyltransferase involved in cell wall biosynthesis